MAHDDFDVIAYKVLTYVYACMKDGRDPDLDRAWELAGSPPEVYWKMVLASLQKDGLLVVQDARYDILGEVTFPCRCGITLDGAAYVRDNSAMRKAGKFLGAAFEKSLAAAVAASQLVR